MELFQGLPEALVDQSPKMAYTPISSTMIFSHREQRVDVKGRCLGY